MSAYGVGSGEFFQDVSNGSSVVWVVVLEFLADVLQDRAKRSAPVMICCILDVGE